MATKLSIIFIFLVLDLNINFSAASTIAASGNFDAYGYATDWSSNWDVLSGRHSEAQCVDIPLNLTLCQNIGYNQMRLPNLLDHDTIPEVVALASTWQPLLGINCHPDTKLFLCSLFSPVCLDRPIWPCRSLCEAVRSGCLPSMEKYGFPWPETLKCNKFPVDNDLCIGLQLDEGQGDKEQEESVTENSVCEQCNQPATFETLAYWYCHSNFRRSPRTDSSQNTYGSLFMKNWKTNSRACHDTKVSVVKLSIARVQTIQNDLRLIPRRRKQHIKRGSLNRRHLRALKPFIEHARICKCPVLNTPRRVRQYLVAGVQKEGLPMATFIVPYSKYRMNRNIQRIKRNKRICTSDAARTPPVTMATPADAADVVAPIEPERGRDRVGRDRGRPRRRRRRRRRRN